MKFRVQRLLYILFSPFLGKKLFQNFFENLFIFSLAGMNYGVVVPERSGEKYFLKYLKSKYKTGGRKIIFDIGANKGEYISQILNIFDNKTLIYAFEPLREACKILESKFGKNKKVKIVNLGLSNRKDNSLIYFDEDKSELASLYERKHLAMSLPVKLDKKKTIKLISLDEFCVKNKISKIDFLKIDAEGNEFKILQGAKVMLEKNQIDYIQFEFGGPMIDSKTYFRDIYLLLSPKFNIFRLLQDGLTKIKKYDEKQEIFIMSNFVAINKSLS